MNYFAGPWDFMFTSGTDENHEGCWVWAAPQVSKFLLPGNWRPGEPDNRFAGQNCMVILKTSQIDFDDINCNYKSAFLCQRPNDESIISLPTLSEVQNTVLC